MANKLFFLILTLCLVSLPAVAQRLTLSDRPLSDRRVSYRINVRLDEARRMLHGTERITWRNPDRVPVSELQFHLYLNAFRSAKTTFMRESGGRHRSFAGSREAIGWINVRQIALVAEGGRASTDLTRGLRYIRPDDGNLDDYTVATLPLPRPVAPGETVTLDLRFDARLPRIFARTGWEKTDDGRDFFMVGQWFPKLGVYEVPGQRYVPADAPRGAWNTHQFHANSEFYADFGTYDVTMDIPEGYVVGATGRLAGEQNRGDRRIVRYRAADVHDFAWTASPAFFRLTDRWKHVDLHLLLQPQHRGQAYRHFEAAKAALAYFERHVGPYPYTTLTLVDGIGGSNGMEYPTLITCGTGYGVPRWARLPETVIVHEFGHQYFYGLLASNEFEEAWLDEGFTSYMEARAMDDTYGKGSVLDLPGLRISSQALQRIQYTRFTSNTGAPFTPSWEYASTAEYGINSYYKPATLLFTLEQMLGARTMTAVLREYYRRYAFRHPTTRDFQQVAEEVSGRDLNSFFEQFIYGNATVDYAVVPGRGSGAAQQEQGVVVVERKSDGVLPVMLRVRLADGSTQTISWSGRERRKAFRFDQAVEEAYLDPENRLRLELNRLNNRYVADADPVYARKMQLKATAWMQFWFNVLASLL